MHYGMDIHLSLSLSLPSPIISSHNKVYESFSTTMKTVAVDYTLYAMPDTDKNILLLNQLHIKILPQNYMYLNQLPTCIKNCT